MAAHVPSISLSARHPPTPSSTNFSACGASTATNLIETGLRLAKDAAEMLKEVPYVKAVAGILVQIIEIRDVCRIEKAMMLSLHMLFPQQIKTLKERSHELIGKVLRRSNVVLDGLIFVAKSSHKELLSRIEGWLTDYHRCGLEPFKSCISHLFDL